MFEAPTNLDVPALRRISLEIVLSRTCNQPAAQRYIQHEHAQVGLSDFKPHAMIPPVHNNYSNGKARAILFAAGATLAAVRIPALVMALLLPGCAGATAGVALTNEFAAGQHGWEAGFADYPPGDETLFALVADHRPRPANLGGENALYISGRNQSDDLFMFWKKHVTALSPNTDYDIVFEIEFASRYATGLFGAGGAPGDSVYLKAGATTVEPQRQLANGHYRMNLDKGNQSAGGQDMIVLGTIAKPDDGNTDYVLVAHTNAANPFRARADSAGQLWLIFGTESGFEGTTSLYYTRFQANFQRLTPPLLALQRDGASQITLTWDDWVLQSSFDLLNWSYETNAASPLIVNLPEAPARFWRLKLP